MGALYVVYRIFVENNTQSCPVYPDMDPCLAGGLISSQKTFLPINKGTDQGYKQRHAAIR
jgi:hypothetical protein